MIQQILEQRSARKADMNAPKGVLQDPRDLIDSAMRARSLGLMPVIAEIKPRILGRYLHPGEAADLAQCYSSLGACAVSVLSEPVYFKGGPEIVVEARGAVGIPVLRKDFILRESDLDEVSSDLVLLIAGLLDDLDDMVEAARARQIEPLVEVHTQKELSRTLKTRARIVGINNRDLSTLAVDLGTFERLGPIARDSGVFTVSESGVTCAADAIRMKRAGADALLVGSALMQDPGMLRLITGI